VLEYASSEVVISSKLCLGATKKLSGEGFKRQGPDDKAWFYQDCRA